MLDELASATLSELFAKLLSETAPHVYSKWRKRAGDGSPNTQLLRVTKIARDQMLHACSNTPAFDNLQIQRFLRGPEFELVTGNMIASSILSDPEEASRQASRQCQLAMRMYGVSPTLAAQCTQELEYLFRAVLEKADRLDSNENRLIDEAARKPGQVAAEEERKEAARHYLEDNKRQIAWCLDVLTTLLDEENVDLEKINYKIDRLRTSIFQVHSVVSPSHVDSPLVIPIDDIYVGPVITADRTSYVVPADIDRLFEDHRRIVLLGDPGGGKTSLTKYLSYLATSPTKKLKVAHLALPITLREHISELTRKPGLDIIQAIQSTAGSHFQVELSRTEASFICLTGRVLLIFDGLDELLELSDRAIVVESIEAFAALHPRCSIFATSRSLGYEQAALNPALFSLYRIREFNEGQVREYARKWFHLAKGLTVHSRDSLLAGFLEESASLSDLRSNPLLLSLMCSLYRHKHYIPKNRAQLYAKCAELLFDDWDRSRRLRQKFDFDGRIDGAIRHLAYWIFTNQEKQSGVLEPEILAEISRYLSDWVYGDMELGEHAAKSFLNFCKNRAWILTEVGTGDRSVGLFQFAHRTFLEYFAAAYIVVNFSEDEISSIVLSHAGAASWNLVCDIVIQLSSKKRQGLEDKIVTELCQRIPEDRPEEGAITLTLCSRVLESIPLRPTTVREVTEKIIDQYLKDLSVAPTIGSHSREAIASRPTYWLDNEHIAVENFHTARAVICKRLNRSMEKSRVPERELAHLIEFNLTPDCKPDMLASVLSSGNRSWLRDLASRHAWEAWIESTALLFQLDGYPVRPHIGMTLGNLHQGKISSVISRWGNKPLPNGVEIVVWLMAHGNELIIENLDRYASAAIKHLRTVPTTAEYSPHALWESAQNIESVPVDYPPIILRAGLRCALALIEHSLDACQTQQELVELASSYASRPWGSLDVLRPMVAARYSLDECHLSGRSRTLVESVGLMQWCRPNGANSAALV
jgi:hypothetical protein